MSIIRLPRYRRFAAVIALAMASTTGGAYVMEQLKSQPVVCNVVGAQKLLAGAGGPVALCEMIKNVASTVVPGIPFAVEIHSNSTHTLAAKISLPDGRVLPDLNITISDRPIDRSSIERFANAIVGEVAEASRS